MIDVAEATRALLTRAAQASPQLRTLEWRVLAAVIVATSTWTRMRDGVYLQELAETCGMMRPRNVGRELASLRDRGLIGYQPGRGRTPGGSGRPGTLSIAPDDAGKGGGTAPLTGERKGRGPAPVTRGKGGGTAPVTSGERGAAHGEKGARDAARKGGGTAPPPEEVPEEVSENDVDVQTERGAEPHPSGIAEVAQALTDVRGWAIDAGIRRSLTRWIDAGWSPDQLTDHLVAQTRNAQGPGLLVTILRDVTPPPERGPKVTRTRSSEWCPNCREPVGDDHQCPRRCPECKGAGSTTAPGPSGPGGRPGGPVLVQCPSCQPDREGAA